MKYNVALNGKNYEVEVEKGDAQLISVTDAAVTPAVVPVVAAPAPVAAPVAAPVIAVPAPVAAPAPASVAAGEQVASPMPGTILSIKVQAGASVKKGDVLLILEAMKMENEIMAPVDGTISQIVTNQGDSVSTGDLLLVIG